MDEIKLPCGLVLTRSKYSSHQGSIGGIVHLTVMYAKNGRYAARFGHIDSPEMTQEECLSWLNSRVEELVASLGAVIVPEDARRKVFAELRRFDATSTDGHLMSETDAVLAALGMVRR